MFKKRNSCSVAATGIKQFDFKPKTYLVQQEVPQQIDDIQLEKIDKKQKRKSKYQRE